MLRLKRTLAGLLSTLVLMFSIITTHIVPIGITTGVATLAVTQTACGPDTLEKLNGALNDVAHSLEAAIDTNGRLYAAGTYGAVGSPGAIQLRQKVATVIHDSNEYLIQALTEAKKLTKATFEGGKLAVLEKLTLAATGLSVGQRTIDLVLQSVATLINQAVAIMQLFNASDVRGIRFAVPKINGYIRTFERLNASPQLLEVIAE